MRETVKSEGTLKKFHLAKKGEKRPRDEREGYAGVRHPFKTKFNDHFETSVEAINDVCFVVNEVKQLMRPSSPESFRIYDPYYCAGAVVESWKSCGISNVINENRDFYLDIANNTVPVFDMLVTNPPFSDVHIPRLLQYLVTMKKPWAFLAPDYIATKEWYSRFIKNHFSSSPHISRKDVRVKEVQCAPSRKKVPLPPFLLGNVDASANCDEKPREPFYLLPSTRYDFAHPLGVGHEHSHFHSMWFISCDRWTDEVIRGARVHLQHRSGAQGGASVVTLVDSLSGLHDILARRKK